MDWSACVICQKKKGELKCPVDSNEENGAEIYANFFEIVKRFKENDIYCLVDLKSIERSDEFMQNRAKWHKSCRLKLTPSKLEKELSWKCKLKMMELTETESREGLMPPLTTKRHVSFAHVVKEQPVIN